MPPESLRLGSAPDGTMPCIKLRGLPFSCGPEEINLFLVSGSLLQPQRLMLVANGFSYNFVKLIEDFQQYHRRTTS